MPEIAKLITLDLAKKKLYIDGTEFPWMVSREGPTFSALADPDEIRRMTNTIFADDVEVLPENPQESAP